MLGSDTPSALSPNKICFFMKLLPESCCSSQKMGTSTVTFILITTIMTSQHLLSYMHAACLSAFIPSTHTGTWQVYESLLLYQNTLGLSHSPDRSGKHGRIQEGEENSKQSSVEEMGPVAWQKFHVIQSPWLIVKMLLREAMPRVTSFNSLHCYSPDLPYFPFFWVFERASLSAFIFFPALSSLWLILCPAYVLDITSHLKPLLFLEKL